jgi:hypothetical protein
MHAEEIARRRLAAQRLTQGALERADAVVSWLGAVQAQDYAGAKWAIGQRMTGATDAALDRAFDAGEILRTHMLRPTWHFVAPADIRWLLALVGPRVQAGNAYMYRQEGLDGPTLARGHAVLVDALAGGRQRTRSELAAALEQAGVPAAGVRLAYIIMAAELDGLICSGARRGKQFTYALLDERAPGAAGLAREDALAELTRRYFRTRGPATLNDCARWSGLTVADVQAGVAACGDALVHTEIDGRAYWLAADAPPRAVGSPLAHLLPNYDEYFIGFADRSAISHAQRTRPADPRGDAGYYHVLVMDGQVVGSWRRVPRAGAMVVVTSFAVELAEDEHRALAEAAQRYSAFLELPVVVDDGIEN